MGRVGLHINVVARIGTLVALIALSLAVVQPVAALTEPAFAKAFSPATIGPGSVSTITFTITNVDASDPVEGLAFVDTLPTGVTVASPSNSVTDCSSNGVIGPSLTAPAGGTTITLTDASVGAASVCTVRVDVTASQPGTYTNAQVVLTHNAGDPATSPAVDLVVAADRPGFTKDFSPDPIDFGERSTLTFTIDNSLNGSAAQFTSFTDILPSGLIIADPPNAAQSCAASADLNGDPGSDTISFSTGFGAGIPSGTSCTISIDVVATSNDVFENSSSELMSTVGASTVSSGKANATLVATASDLHLTKSFIDDPVPPGGTATLEFTIDNFDRTDSAASVSFTDPLPAGVTVASAATNDCGGIVTAPGGGTTISLSGGTIAPEGACTITIGVGVSQALTPGVYVNTTGAVSGTVGGNQVVGNEASGALFVVAAPVLTKEFTDGPVAAGESVILEFTITDTTSSGGSSNIAFVDELTGGGGDGGVSGGFLGFPVSVTLPPVPDPPCGLASSLDLVSLGTERQGLSLTGGSLASGATCSFEVVIDIPPGFPGGTYTNTTEEITAHVSGSTVTGAPASADLVVVGAPSLRKEFTDDPIAPGDSVELEFTLNHEADSPGVATAITFTDDLAGFGVTGLTATGLPLIGACDPDGPGGVPGTGTLSSSAGDTLLTFVGGALSPGDSCTFTVGLETTASASQGVFTNTTSAVDATVAGKSVEGLPASDDLVIADLTVAKSFTDDPVLPGGTVTLEYTIDNGSATSGATAISFTDDLDDLLPGLSASAGELPLAGCGGTLSGFAGDTAVFFSGGAVPAAASCSFSLALDVPGGAVPDTYAGPTSAVSATIGGSQVVLPAAVGQVVVAPLPSVDLIKVFTDDPTSPGGTVTMEFTIENSSLTHAVSDIGFTDDLSSMGIPAPGVTTNLPPVPDPPCGADSSLLGSAGDTFLTFAGGDLAPNSECTFSVTLSIPATTPDGSYTNTTSSVIAAADTTIPISGVPGSDDLHVGPGVVGPMCNGLPVTVDIGAGQTPTPGDDVILGTEGVDIIDADAGDDTICALGGDDRIQGRAGADTIFGGPGDDLISGGGGGDNIAGDGGSDEIQGNAGNDTLEGGPDNDVLNGGNGADMIFGGGGDDVIGGQAGADLIFGQAGNDQVFGGVGNDEIWGGPGDDDLRGQGNKDVLWGEAGIDQFFGGSGDDTIRTGPGGNSGTAQVVRGQGNNDLIFGGADNDHLDGGPGLDKVLGGGGDDILTGGNAADELFGEAGDDTLIGAQSGDLLLGGDNDDTLIGGTGDDDLFGEGGADSMNGQGGTDLCDGGSGSPDTVVGGCEIILGVP